MAIERENPPCVTIPTGCLRAYKKEARRSGIQNPRIPCILSDLNKCEPQELQQALLDQKLTSELIIEKVDAAMHTRCPFNFGFQPDGELTNAHHEVFDYTMNGDLLRENEARQEIMEQYTKDLGDLE